MSNPSAVRLAGNKVLTSALMKKEITHRQFIFLKRVFNAGMNALYENETFNGRERF